MPSVLKRAASSAACERREGECVRPRALAQGVRARRTRASAKAEEKGNRRTRRHCGRVQAGERDELDREPSLAEVPNERLELLLRVAVRAPVERRREVVDEPLARVRRADLAGERLRLDEVGRLGLEPEEVGEVGEGERALERGLRTASKGVISTVSAREAGREKDEEAGRRTAMPPR